MGYKLPPFPELQWIDPESAVKGSIGVLGIEFFKTFPPGLADLKVQTFAWEFSVAEGIVFISIVVIIQGKELYGWGIADGDQAK